MVQADLPVRVPSSPAGRIVAKRAARRLRTRQGFRQLLLAAGFSLGLAVLTACHSQGALVVSGPGTGPPVFTGATSAAVAAGAVAAAHALGPAGQAAASQPGPSRSSLTTSLLNLSKNIIGAGMLSLPFAMKGAGVLPFFLGMLLMGSLNAYSFYLLGWCCHATGAKSFGELWSKTFGKSSAWVADASVLVNNGLALLAYSILVGDFMSKALAGLLPAIAALHGRGANLVLVAMTLLIPLSLLRDLSPLRFSSLLGLAATLYGFLLVAWDCAAQAPILDPQGPVLLNLLPARVDFFQALALLSSAFMAHYNSPKYYADLEDNTLPRFGTLVSGAFGFAVFIFGVFAFAGFALFGFGVEGNVLKNYGAGTKVMLAWLGMAFSIVFTYPLVFSTFRDSFASLLFRRGLLSDVDSQSFRVPFTVAAVALTVLGGTFLSNIAIVNGVKGAVMSACLAFIYPAIIHLRLTGPGGAEVDSGKVSSSKAMRILSMILIGTGLVSGVLALLAMFVLPRTDFSQFAQGGPGR